MTRQHPKRRSKIPRKLNPFSLPATSSIRPSGTKPPKKQMPAFPSALLKFGHFFSLSILEEGRRTAVGLDALNWPLGDHRDEEGGRDGWIGLDWMDELSAPLIFLLRLLWWPKGGMRGRIVGRFGWGQSKPNWRHTKTIGEGRRHIFRPISGQIPLLPKRGNKQLETTAFLNALCSSFFLFSIVFPIFCIFSLPTNIFGVQNDEFPFPSKSFFLFQSVIKSINFAFFHFRNLPQKNLRKNSAFLKVQRIFPFFTNSNNLNDALKNRLKWLINLI